jgi:cyanophycin synthetase
MHHYPSEGQPRDVAAAIVAKLFRDGDDGRIPIVAITGTNGKTTVTRMIDHILRADGRPSGMTTTDGICVGGQEVMRGDTTGPYSAQVVLSDPTVEVAVLETARGGIARRGLGYDWSDVGVLTNVSGDHIGQDGIRSVDDLLEIKALVAERVRPGGTLVLNADDERLVALAERPSVAGRTVVFFSLDRDNAVVAEHVARGGTAWVLEDREIVRRTREERRVITPVRDLPITLGGVAEFQAANAIAAIAACEVLGVDAAAAACALTSFRSTRHNPGRMNLFSVRDGYVLIDYGHNPDAFRTMARLAKRWTGRRRTGIVGVPGDRDDATIIESGRVVAGAFDRVILREDVDLRGRESGETSEMLCDAIVSVAPSVECRTVLDECAALRDAIATMEPGEVVILFYEKLEPVLDELARHGASPVESLDTAESEMAATSTNERSR